MRFKVLIAVLTTALIAGVVAAASMATPAPALKITPTSQLQFGSVPVDTMSDVKPVEILNRSDEWVYYSGADWPGVTGTWPYGIWERDPGDPYAGGSQPWDSSGCDWIAPKSQCTLYFAFDPAEPGLVTEEFWIQYTGEISATDYLSQTITMMGTGY